MFTLYITDLKGKIFRLMFRVLESTSIGNTFIVEILSLSNIFEIAIFFLFQIFRCDQSVICWILRSKPFLFDCLWWQHLWYDMYMACTIFAFFSLSIYGCHCWLKSLAFQMRLASVIAMFNARIFRFFIWSIRLLSSKLNSIAQFFFCVGADKATSTKPNVFYCNWF